MKPIINIAILGSGTGSNAQALLTAQQKNELGQGNIVGILSDQPGARILTLPQQFPGLNVQAQYLSPGQGKNRFDISAQAAYAQQLKAWGVQLVVLAGFMRVIKAPLLEAFPGRILNLHPSLLPKHPGLDAQAKALAAGDTQAGCTVHWVNAEIDAGEIIAQQAVPIQAGDTPATLSQRIQQAEHTLLPQAVRTVCAQLSKQGA